MISGSAWSQFGVSPDIPTPMQDAMMRSGYTPEDNAMALGSFYACVTLLADIISSMGVNAYRTNADGTKTLVTPQPPLFINSPYPETTWFSWLWMLLEAMAVTGNGFGYITARGDDMRPTAILPVHPDFMNIELPNADIAMSWPDPKYFIDGKHIPSEDVVHIKRYPIAGSAVGMSPVQKAAASVGLGLAAERYGLRYFRDSANPSGILHTDQELTPEQARQAQKGWMKGHQQRRLPAVMSGGLKWQSVTLTPEESQFLETRQFQRSEIAMWFRIPPHMIGDTSKSTTWGTGIENMTLGFVKYTLMPWLTCIEQALSAYLPRGQTAKFNTSDLLRGDIKTRFEAYNIGRNAGMYSSNEMRAQEDLPSIGPDGDIRLQPSNFVPLGTDPKLLYGATNSPPSSQQNSRDNRPADINPDGADEENNEDDSP